MSEGLHFLHDSVKMLHRNLSPESIVVNHQVRDDRKRNSYIGKARLVFQGAWKIFGFDFCVPNSAPANQPPSWVTPEYSHNTPAEGYPDLVSRSCS